MHLLLQLADSAFPSGGFAHSGGLESAMQHGLVRSHESLAAFAGDTISQTARGSLPLVTTAHGDASRFDDLDDLCDAVLSNPVANRASRAQGRAMLTSCARSFGGSERTRPTLVDLSDHIAGADLPAHYAPIFGVVTRALDIELRDAQQLFLFLAGRGVASAAVRLGLLGAYDAQALQASLAQSIKDALDRFGTAGIDGLAQTAPLIDLSQARHDRLYSRLFQS